MIESAIKLRHELHKCAELSGHEAKTKELLMAAIRSDTKLEVRDRGSWFYAYYDCGADDATGGVTVRNIAFRADMDALPMDDIGDLKDPCTGYGYSSETAGVSHRCGHDGHCAALYALARLLSERGASNNVCLIFQHAEETGAGARECAKLIDEKKIEEIYAFHNWSGFDEGSVVLREGAIMCASEGLRITMKGKASHASRPEDGANPAEALAQLAAKAGRFGRDELFHDRVMVTIVGINTGGRNFGMAPGEGEVDITLRARCEEDMLALEREIIACAEEKACESDLEVSFEKEDAFPETANAADAVAKVRASAEKLGLKIYELENPVRSSEDFGRYCKKCSGAMIFIGNGKSWPQIHTTEYDFNDRILGTAAELFHTVISV